MQLSFIVITGNKVIGFTGREKQDPIKTKEYLADVLKRRGFSHKVTITGDRTQFISLLKNSGDAPEGSSGGEKAGNEAEQQELCRALESLMV